MKCEVTRLIMNFSSWYRSGGEGEDDEGRVLDMASVVVPTILGSVLVIGIVIYLIRLCYKKYWKGYPADDDQLIHTNQCGDIESLTGGNRGESRYDGDNPYAFTTITGLSDTNDRDLSQRSTLSSVSSFYSIAENANDGSVGQTDENGVPVGPAYFVSRGAQTDLDPTVEYMKNYKRDRPPIPKSDQFDQTAVYTISGIGATFQADHLPGGSRSVLECFNEACVVSLNEDRSSLHNEGPTTPISKSPLMHFDNFEQFADCAYVDLKRNGKNAPLRILKPILDSISSSSGQSLPATSSSSSLSKEKHGSEQSYDGVKSPTKVDSSWKRKRKINSFGTESPKKPFVPTVGVGVKEEIIKEQKALLKEQKKLKDRRKNTGYRDFWRLNQLHLDICKESLKNITILEYLVSDKKPLLPEGLTCFEKKVTENCIRFLQEVQKTSLEIKVNSIQLAQQLLQFYPTNCLEKEGLVIGVDATHSHFGGYCVNLAERNLQFYIVEVEKSPWPVVQKMNPDEFEMKNFRFALCLWHREIEEVKTFEVYTDNRAVLNAKVNKSTHGLPVLSLLDHFRQCHGATLRNDENIFVNRVKDLKSFAKHIQPADDLSRLRIERCVDFLCEQYSIPKENVRGTHQRNMVKNPSKLEKTPFYQEVLDEVNSFVQTLSCQQHCMGSKKNLKRNLNSSAPEVSSGGSHPRLSKERSQSPSPVGVEMQRRKKRRRQTVNPKRLQSEMQK